MQSAYNNLIRFYLFFLCIGQIRQVLESLGLTSYLVRVINIYGVYFFYPVLLIILIINSKARIKKIDLLLYFFLIGYPILTLGYFYDVPYSVQYRLTDILMPGFFFLSIALARTSNIDFSFVFKTRLLKLYLIVSTISILTALQFEIRYQSLASVQLLFLFSYYFYQKGIFNKILVYIDIFLSGKRGLLVFIFSLFSKSTFLHIILISVLSYAVISLELLPSKYMNTFSLIGDVSFLEVLGARGKEISEVISYLGNNPHAFFTGFGSGFYYVITDSSGLLQVSHNVHFSPLGLISTYGILYCILTYAFLSMIYKKSSKKSPVFRMYLLLGILYSFTAYSLFVDFLFLISLCGLKSNVRR